MPKASDGLAGGVPVSRLFRWMIGVLALSACGVSAFLLYHSLANDAQPPGCGAGSGCVEVLSSRWSQVFGIPVSGPAMMVYALLLAATFFIGPSSSLERQRVAWSVLTFLSAVVAASAVWFIALQVVVIRAICPWCVVGHVLGLTAATMVFCKTPVSKASLQAATATGSTAESSVSLPPRRLVMLRLLGLVAVCVLATGQMFDTYRPPGIHRLQAGVNDDTGSGPNRIMSVLNGKLQLQPHQLPRIGSADAPKQLVLLFDYCCPHCRLTHGYLIDAEQRYPNQLGIVLLPMPLNSDCNPYWEHTDQRFEHACELARLALAVWRADAAAFREFDAWLFLPEDPRDPDKARQEAEQLVGAAALDAALADPWINERIKQDAQAYHDSRAERIPVIMSPRFAAIVGRPESGEELFVLLEKELKLQATDE